MGSQRLPGTTSSNYNNIPALVPVTTATEQPIYAYKFPVQAYSGYMYNEMPASNVHRHARNTSNLRDYYRQIPNNAGSSNIRRMAMPPRMPYVAAATMSRGRAFPPHCKSNMHRKMAHVHSPRVRSHATCHTVNNGVMCISSDSEENEFTWLSYVRQHASHLHDSRSQCDADVSGTSTDPDLDDNLLKSSDESNVDFSNHSTFGSSHLASDISSFNSKVYVTRGGSSGGGISLRNGPGKCCKNVVSARSLRQSMALALVTDDSDTSMVSVDTSSISPVDVSDSWSDKTCDNGGSCACSTHCRTSPLRESSRDSVMMTALTSIACDVSTGHDNNHVRTSCVGQKQRRSLQYWHDKTNALNRGRCCYSLATRRIPWRRCNVSSSKVAQLIHRESCRNNDDRSFVDCATEDRLAFDETPCANACVNACGCAVEVFDSCAMIDDVDDNDVCPSGAPCKDGCDAMAISDRTRPRDPARAVSDRVNSHLVKERNFTTRKPNGPIQCNSGPSTDLSGPLTDKFGVTDDDCLLTGSGSSKRNQSESTKGCGPRTGHNSNSREHRTAMKCHGGKKVDHSGVARDRSGLVRDHSGLKRDRSGLATSDQHCAFGYRDDIAKNDRAKGKYCAGTKRARRGSTMYCDDAENNRTIAQMTARKETVVSQSPHGESRLSAAKTFVHEPLNQNRVLKVNVYAALLA